MPIFTQPEGDAADFLETSRDELAKKYGIEQFEYPFPDSQIKHIGFNPKEQTWYGWSHRAIYGFKVGDEITKGHAAAQDPNYPSERALPVGFKAKTLDDARRMAAAFADAVS